MAKFTLAKTLQGAVKKLMKERARHENALMNAQAKIDEIDSIFSGLNLSSVGVKGVKVARGPKPGSKRTRQTFPITGEESVLQYVQKHGRPSAKEVNEHWKKEGRGGSANNTLTRLVKEKKLKRVEAEDARGGRYVLP